MLEVSSVFPGSIAAWTHAVIPGKSGAPPRAWNGGEEETEEEYLDEDVDFDEDDEDELEDEDLFEDEDEEEFEDEEIDEEYDDEE